MIQTLLEDIGPNGNLQAVVESDEKVCYFYLYGAPETGFPTKSVWVRNLVDAPESLDIEQMREGTPPLNPRPHCRYSQGLAVPDPETLEVVWLPEGHGAALYEGDEILAIIPPWSGMNGFDGFARDCVGLGPLAWELTESNALIQRFEDAQNYWEKWDDDLWPTTQSSLLRQIEGKLGPNSNYYAIDGGEWPPKALIRIPREDCVVLVTIGVSLRPQPNVELSTDEPELFRRIELGAALPKHWPDTAIKRFASYLSRQSNLPWTNYTWLGSGHTIPCDSWQNPEFTSAMLTCEHPAVPPVAIGPVLDDPVNILWFVPITEAECDAAIEKGTEQMAAQLPEQRWNDA